MGKIKCFRGFKRPTITQRLITQPLKEVDQPSVDAWVHAINYLECAKKCMMEKLAKVQKYYEM